MQIFALTPIHTHTHEHAHARTFKRKGVLSSGNDVLLHLHIHLVGILRPCGREDSVVLVSSRCIAQDEVAITCIRSMERRQKKGRRVHSS